MGAKVKVSCLECGVTNNFPIEASGKKVVCGRCRCILPEPGIVVSPLPQQAYTLVKKATLPVLVDFYSHKIASCHVMHLIIEDLTKKRAGKIMTLKLSIKEHPEIGSALGITSFPTYIIFYRGNERARTSGAMPEEEFTRWVDSIILP